MESNNQIGAFAAVPVNLEATPKVHHLPTWKDKDDPTRVAALRKIVMQAGRDPRLATIAVNIVRNGQAEPRDYKKQAALLLSWVQSQIYYVNEPGERLQDPMYTLNVRYGDCDDMAILLASFYEALRLPWRFVLSGRAGDKTIRWIEGTPKKKAKWAHIYVIVGWPPYTPQKWLYAEPTLKGVPLGWDVVGASSTGKLILPELGSADSTLERMASTSEGTPSILEKSTGSDLADEIVTETKRKLHPRSLVPAIILGLVAGSITEVIKRSVGKARKKATTSAVDID